MSIEKVYYARQLLRANLYAKKDNMLILEISASESNKSGTQKTEWQ